MAKKGGTPLGHNSRSVGKGNIGNVKSPATVTPGGLSSGGNTGKVATGKIQGKPTIGAKKTW